MKGIFLETAHSVKFPDAVEAATGKSIKIPASLESIMKSKKVSISIGANYSALKEFLTNR